MHNRLNFIHYYIFYFGIIFVHLQLKKNYLNCSIMPAVLTRPKKKVVIENTFIEKDKMTTKESICCSKRGRTQNKGRKKEKRGTRKIRS